MHTGSCFCCGKPPADNTGSVFAAANMSACHGIFTRNIGTIHFAAACDFALVLLWRMSRLSALPWQKRFSAANLG